RFLRETPVDAVVTDLRMPDVDGLEIVRVAAESQPDAKVIIITAFATIASAIDAVKQGAFDYVSKPFEIEELVLALERAVEDSRLRRENRSLRGEVTRRFGLENFIGASSAMQEVFALVQGASRADLNVLVTGESGTGKELTARAIHYGGPRRGGPFVALNCAAIPETLLESELFGHVRGAFTGAATARKGLVEEAHGGTLFLDEISEMSVALQAKLLRVLEDREVRPLGSNRGAVVEFRAIASTNRDARAQVEAGTFRPDLYYRLNVVGIHLPPLRERTGDIPRLARHFVEEFAAHQRRPVLGLTPDAMALVESYAWPGNVRELENAMERAVAFARAELIASPDLPPAVRDQGRIVEAGIARSWSLRELTERYVERVLAEVQGDRTRAARILGVHPRTLERRDRQRTKDLTGARPDTVSGRQDSLP
ncbi:MAG: sigma-54-dependent transcriptional regulator, partial [Candidatus Rokuibacteriota bacterium]